MKRISKSDLDTYVKVKEALDEGIVLTVGTDDAMAGTAQLTNGDVTVYTTAVTAETKIILSPASYGAGGNYKAAAADIVPGVSFVIRSNNGADDRIFNWFLIYTS